MLTCLRQNSTNSVGKTRRPGGRREIGCRTTAGTSIARPLVGGAAQVDCGRPTVVPTTGKERKQRGGILRSRPRGPPRASAPTKRRTNVGVPRRVRAKHERIKSVFAVGLPRQKLPEAKRHASPRADQPSEARAMEREYSNGKPSEAGFRLRARQRSSTGIYGARIWAAR